MTKKIILVFKTHFDIGFTDLAEHVIRDYGGPMLRQVIETCRATERLGPLRYVWTMPAWPLWYITEHCEADLRPELERLIENGQIVWHALPFTSHTDFCAPEEYAQGLRYARLLAERYGKPCPVAGKMTDVPGHGLMLPELLDQAGIRFLHLGCNEFASPPQVPGLFFWRSPAGGQVLTMYSKGGYGTSLLPPEDWPFPVWMALMHTHDNCGPQSGEIILRLAEEARAACPEAEIVCGTMDDFYRELAACDLSGVPVVTEDLADTWIHGVGSYPAEVSRMREGRLRARRLHREAYRRFLRGQDPDPALEDLWDRYYEQVCLFEEHTWGADVKTWLGPDRVYEKPAFREARKTAPYQFMEASWREQRRRAEESGALLDRIGTLLPLPAPGPAPAGELRVSGGGEAVSVENHRYRLTFDSRTGTIRQVYDKALAVPLLAARDGMGVFTYQYDRYGFSDINEFLRDYAYHFTTWGIQDYGRENYPDCAHRSFRPDWEGYEIRDDRVIFRYAPHESAVRCGDCEQVILTVTLPAEGDAFQVELALERKQATPYVESGSLVFPLPGWSGCRLHKPCAVVDPETDIAPCANHALLNMEEGITVLGETARLFIRPLDTPLVSVGSPGVYEYHRQFPRDRRPELWFNLFNNMWGTNFPQWIEGSFRFRYEVRAAAADGEELLCREQLSGIPEGMELVCMRRQPQGVCVTLRDHGGRPAERTIRLPGGEIAPADLLGRPLDGWRREERAFIVRPNGLHNFILRREGGPLS